MSQYSAKGSAYRRHAARLKAQGKANATPCCLCGGRILYDAHYLHPLAFTVEHPHQLSQGGALIQEGMAPAHRRCQNQQGAQTKNRGMSRSKPLRYSTDW